MAIAVDAMGGDSPLTVQIEATLKAISELDTDVVLVGAEDQIKEVLTQHSFDPNKLRKKIQTYQNKGKKVKAVIGIDYAGHPCDWRSLKDIADEFDLKLINDNCHALGAKYDGDDSYAIKFADIVTHSYHPVKHITTGEGGAVLTTVSYTHLRAHET